jgi:GNAT superfamily N-acetyltransferase
VLKKRGEPDSHPTFTYPKNEDIYDYFVGLADRLNVWEAYPDVNEYIEMFGISVCPEYRKQGIAKEIYRRVLALMKVRGIKVARCGFTSPFSRKAAKSQGCKIFVEEPVCQAKLKDGRYLNSNAAPEDISDYGVFEVDLN